MAGLTGWPDKFYVRKSGNVMNEARPGKIHKVMSEFKHGALHSGSKKGPKVTSREQAIAIAMSEAGMSRKKRKR